jgi:hypothetical protein
MHAKCRRDLLGGSGRARRVGLVHELQQPQHYVLRSVCLEAETVCKVTNYAEENYNRIDSYGRANSRSSNPEDMYNII